MQAESGIFISPEIRKDFVRGYIITMRPYLLFVSGITGIAGMSFANAIPATSCILLFSACFLSYGFGQALTDCFQIDTDSLSSPYRPLTRGVISRTRVLLTSIIGLCFCISILSVFHPLNLLLGAISGLGLGTYTWFKRRWWAGPVYNAWIVVLLCLMAFLAGATPVGKSLNKFFLWTLLVVFFGYTNFVLIGYFKDIEADRATKYNTLPVVFGRTIATRISHFLALGTVITMIASLYRLTDSTGQPVALIASLTFAVTGTIAALLAQVRLRKVIRDEAAHAAIVPSLHSYILILSSMASMQKPNWVIFLVIYYVGFVVALRLRPKESQI